jgi:four helix bundle protein
MICDESFVAVRTPTLQGNLMPHYEPLDSRDPAMPFKQPAQSFRDLLVWRKAHQFVIGIYKLSAQFPKQETFALALQLRRAGVSIPANIAEGFGRRGRADKARFMNIAEGSIEECRYYLILANDLGYGSTDELTSLLEEVSRMLHAYAIALRAPIA